MGAANSRKKYRKVKPTVLPSRHKWNRVQDVDYVDSDDDKSQDDLWWLRDRRVIQDEKSDWPRSCPILHLNIQKDFPLEKQRSFVRSCYRFWLFSWWITVVQFVAVMASLVTSNVVNTTEMLLSFGLSIVYFFVVFACWFRPLYWALRLESNVMFIWFYLISFLMIAYFCYQISVALSLVSIMAQPLAPGSNLPVKVNPIFSVVLFTIVVAFFVMCTIMMIYYISTALKLQRMTDEKKVELYKQQRKRKWIAPWFGGTDDQSYDSQDETKPSDSFPVILSYEKVHDDFTGDDVDEKKSSEKKSKRPNKKGHEHDRLTVPGVLEIYPATRKITFRATEPIFGRIFKMNILLLNVQTYKKKDSTWFYIIEKLNESIDEFEKEEFRQVSSTCTTKGGTIRVLKYDFETNRHRDQCYKRVDKLWRIAKKKKAQFISADACSAKEQRRAKTMRSVERAAQHLLTHKDWGLLVGLVERHEYRAGDIILPKRTKFDEIMYIASGTMDVYLETSESAEEKLRKKESDMFENGDFDLQAKLFPIVEKAVSPKVYDPSLGLDTQAKIGTVNEPTYYAVRFILKNHHDSLGIRYSIQKRKYDLEWIHGKLQNLEYQNKRFYPENQAAIVTRVCSGSIAENLGIRKHDEIVKIGNYDIELSCLTKKDIKRLIKSSGVSFVMQFRRPPSEVFQIDANGYFVSNVRFIPDELRNSVDSYVERCNETFKPRVRSNIFTDSTLDVYGMDEQSDSSERTSGTFSQNDDVKSFQGLVDLANDDSSQSDLLDLRGSTPDHDITTNNAQNTKGFEFFEDAEKYAMEHTHPSEQHSNQEPKRQQQRAQFQSQSSGAHLPKQSSRNQSLEDTNNKEESDSGHEISHPLGFSARILSRGKAFFFGNSVKYQRVENLSTDAKVYPVDEDPESDDEDLSATFSAARNARNRNSSETASEDGVPDDIFSSIRTFEPVGIFEKGDVVGIIPWILKHEESVVQLRAKTDLVFHTVKFNDLGKLLRKNGTLALSFYKYIASVIGERADRDEETLVDEIEDIKFGNDMRFRKPTVQPLHALTRLLDQKPIRSTQETHFENNEKVFQGIRELFEKGNDMAYDCLIQTYACHLTIMGDISTLIGKTWYGVDTKDIQNYSQMKKGRLILTHSYLCFRTDSMAISFSAFKRAPCLYGKLHINDIYDMHHFGQYGEGLTILTDNLRLDIGFETPRITSEIEEWIDVLINTGSVAEAAPNSYTLPGDFYGLSSGTNDPDISNVIANDPLNVVYTQQYKLRCEFLNLTQSLQHILTNSDKYQLFNSGKSVMLRKGQNVIVASRYEDYPNDDEHEDTAETRGDDCKRRTRSTKATISMDGPNGLYLVGQGELVVQREVAGRRVQFASYKVGTVFGTERFLTGAPSPFTVKVSSERCLLRFAPRDHCMALMRADLSLASRFYQYCCLIHMQRLRGPVLSKPLENPIEILEKNPRKGTKGCSIL